ncbi:MAG: porin family protein [Bacteroidales bacterium]|nr:porin family protein [Bacteroidales bacterium]
MKTKNSIMLLIASVTLVSTSAFAQINFGLRSGLAATTFSDQGNLYQDNKVTFSYTGGVFANIPVIKSFSIQPELNYVRKGRSNETTELNTTVKTDFMLHYLQVPVLFQYRNDQLLNKSGSVFYINGGPYAAFVLNTQTRVSDNNEGVSLVPVNDSKNTDWGATLGIGFQTPVFKKDICFDLRYDIGMSEIQQQPTEYRSKALSFTIGIVL